MLRNASQDQLGRCFITVEMTAAAYRFSHFALQTLNRLRGVDDPAHRRREAMNGIIYSQLRRLRCAIAEYFCPQGPGAEFIQPGRRGGRGFAP